MVRNGSGNIIFFLIRKREIYFTLNMYRNKHFAVFITVDFEKFSIPFLWKLLYQSKQLNLVNISWYILCIQYQDFLKFVGASDRAGRKSQGPTILPSMPFQVSDNIFCLCILFCTGNRKCNWYAGTNTVNSELDSASNKMLHATSC